MSIPEGEIKGLISFIKKYGIFPVLMAIAEIQREQFRIYHALEIERAAEAIKKLDETDIG